jgi:hypothetical protein
MLDGAAVRAPGAGAHEAVRGAHAVREAPPAQKPAQSRRAERRDAQVVELVETEGLAVSFAAHPGAVRLLR